MPKIILWLIAALFTASLNSLQAQAQTIQSPTVSAVGCAYNSSVPTLASGTFGLAQCDSTGHLMVAGTFSATLSGFTPASVYSTPLSVTSTTSNIALPAGAVVAVYNPGATNAYVKLGPSNAVVATTADDVIPPGGGCGFTVGSNTFLAAITSATNTTLNISGGSGLLSGCWGGGSSGGGGGGAITSPLGTNTIANSVTVTPATSSLWTQAQGGSAISAANPTFASLSIAGAVNAVGNPVFVSPGTGATWAATESGTWNITNISGTISLPTGAATASNQTSVISAAGSASASALDVQGIAGGTALPISGSLTNISGTISLPTGASTSALQTTGNTSLSSILTALGSPFQVGGTIGNTSFVATQNTAANLNATVVGTGTFATQLTGATNNINNISGTITLPTLAATSTKQSDGTQKTQVVDGSGNVIASTSNNLNVQCANCSGSGVSTADEASFTAGASLFAGSGGFFQTTATNNALTTGQQGMLQVTANRALFTNLRNAAGTEVGTSGAPLRIDPTGTTPQPATQSGTWNITNISGTVSLPTGASTSAKQPDVIAASGTATSGTVGTTAMGASTTGAPTYTTGSSWPLSLTPVGNLRVDGSSVTQPVSAASSSYASGAFAAGSGVDGWDVTEGTKADAAWTSGSGSVISLLKAAVGGITSSIPAGAATIGAVNQAGTWNVNNVSGTVSLPTGASTSALQPTSEAFAGQTSTGTTGTLMFAASVASPTATAGSNWPLFEDTSGNLKVNCTTGCAGGTFNNNADTVSTSSSNGQAASWPYVWNGTTWDRLYGDKTNGAFVNVKTGSLTANAGTNLNTSALALESGNLATLVGGITASVYQDNVKQINGVTPLMGNGTTGTGSQRVTIASDNTAFNVNAVESGAWNITNVSGTVSLPTGASTSALQPTSNAVAGTTTTGTTGTTIFGAATTAAPTDTTGSNWPLSLTTLGGLRQDLASVNSVAVLTGTGAVGTGAQRIAVGTDTATIAGTAPASITTPAVPPGGGGPMSMGLATTAAPTDTTTFAYPLSLTTAGSLRTDLNSVLGVTQLVNTGATGAGSPRMTVAVDAATIAGSAPSTKLLVTPDSVALPANQSVNVSQINAVTPLMGNGVTGTGSQRVTIASDNTPFQVQPVPSTLGGLSTFYLQPAATTNATNIKASAGQVYHVMVGNNSATVHYLEFFNTAGTPTCTNTPFYEMVIPASTAGAGFVQDIAQGLAFGTGIGICVTSAIGGTGNATASALTVTIGYK